MTPEKFKKWRQKLGEELIRARVHFSICEQLWPSKESMTLIKRFRGFFLPTRDAHLSLFFLQITKITDRRKDCITFWRFLEEAEKSPSLIPKLSIPMKELRERLEANSNILKSIRTHRNKRIAHLDERCSWPDSPIWKDNPVTYGEAKKLLQNLESIFGTLSVAHDGLGWFFEPIRREDTSRLLQKLRNNQ